MRCNQVSIMVERFCEYVPEEYPADVQRIHVYCDDFKSIYAALSKAYAMVINELAQYEKIGARTDIHTNEFSGADYRQMHNAMFESKSKYEDDVNLDYSDTRIQLYRDLVWAYENSDEIMDVIKQCKDEGSMKEALMDCFGLNEYQVRKLSQIRFEMLTEKDYQSYKKEIEMMQASREKGSALYHEQRARETEIEIKRLEAYFAAAEHYEEIIKWIVEIEDMRKFERIMKEKFGFSLDESRMIRYLNVKDFGNSELERNRERMERLREMLGVWKPTDLFPTKKQK